MLPPERTTFLLIDFTPPTVDIHLGLLKLATNGPSNFTFGLRGVAYGVGTTNETGLHFGTVTIGGSATLPLHVTNTGVAGSPTVSFTNTGSGYSVLPGSSCVTTGVTSGQTCTLQVQFAPAQPGSDMGSMIITATSGTVSKVALSGTGVAP